MGRWHAEAVKRCGARVAAVVDTDLVRATALAARYDGARATRSLPEALEGGGLDVAHVCTPFATHASVTSSAITAGLHALVEKPLASSASEVRELLASAQRAGRLLCPVHQFVFQRGIRTALSALHTAGSLLHVDAVARSAGADDQSDAARDRIADDILPHALAIVARIAPDELASARWSVARPASGEIRAVGASARLTMSLLVSMSARPTVNALTLSAERATIHLDLFHGFAVVERGGASRRNKLLRPFRVASASLAVATANLVRRGIDRELAYPGLMALTRQFYAAAQGGAPPPFPEREILLVADAWDTVRGAPRL